MTLIQTDVLGILRRDECFEITSIYLSIISCSHVQRFIGCHEKEFLDLLLFFLPSYFRYWDTRQANPVHIQQLPERCYALTVRHPLMIVGTADRNLIVYNLQSPQVFFSLYSVYITINDME